MTSVEIFSGCGGLAKGLEQAGFEHLAFVEFNKWACESLRLNFSSKIVHEIDVRKFDFAAIESVDLVAGGPPCQPFSLGGLARAYEDHRDMFPQAIRAIRELKPKAFIFENVKGLLRNSFREYFKYIIARLTYPNEVQMCSENWQKHAEHLESIIYPKYADLKYRVQFKLLNAADYGVPQVRERVFIVGLRSDIVGEWKWPERVLTPKERQTIGNVIRGLPDPQTTRLIKDHVYVGGARSYPGHTGSDINKPSKTIKAGAHGVPGGENMIRFEDGSVRYMTVHEAKLIQTFPPDFQISGSWGEALRQIGNAVPVRLAASVGRQLFNLLSNHERVEQTTMYRTGTDGGYMLFDPKPDTAYLSTRSKKRRKKA